MSAQLIGLRTAIGPALRNRRTQEAPPT